MNIVVIVHYFPPINSSGAKRWEFMSKYIARAGHNVTVITTRKSGADGAFSEAKPNGVTLVELDHLGRCAESRQGNITHSAMYDDNPSFGRKVRRFVQRLFGQLPDPRLPFALSFAGPFLSDRVRTSFQNADLVVGSCPPWSMLLAAKIAGWRFRKPVILDYRDQFSGNYEMPGSRLAKFIEKVIDKWLLSDSKRVVAISPPMSEYYEGFGTRPVTILNGYDHETLESAHTKFSWKVKRSHDPIYIRYMGLVTPRCIPHSFLAALRSLKDQRRDLYDRLKIQYYGSYSLMQFFVQKNFSDLTDIITFHEPVPYLTSIGLMIEADYLLFSDASEMNNASSKGILTTKLFENIASGRPIIGEIDARTLAGQLIVDADSRHIVSTDRGCFESLLNSKEFWSPAPSRSSPIAPQLSRKYAAEQYIKLMSEILDRTDISTDWKAKGQHNV